MFKRVTSGTSKALIFVIGPSLKCSYQNMATNLKAAVGPNMGPSPSPGSSLSWMVSSSGGGTSAPAVLVKEGMSNVKSSRIREGFGRGRRGRVLGLGFSLGILGFFEKELTVEDKILMEMKRAILAIQEGDIKKAESHLDKAWFITDNEGDELEQMEKTKTQILDIRANLKFQVGDLLGAEKLFKTVCQRLVYHQEVSVKDNAIIEISIKLSQIMALTGRHNESMSGFQYCADTQKEKIEKEGIQDEDTILLAAWSLHSLAQAYLSKGTHPRIDETLVKKASELATEAYNYASKAIGSDSSQAVAISSDIASIYALQGDIDAALERYKECEAIAAEKHAYLQPAIRVNTGSLYLQKGNYDEAEKLCKEAKKLAKRFLDKESALRAEECIVRVGTMKAEDEEFKEQRVKKGSNSSSSSDSSSGLDK